MIAEKALNIQNRFKFLEKSIQNIDWSNKKILFFDYTRLQEKFKTKALSLYPKSFESIPRTNKHRIVIDWLERANPFPPLLNTFQPSYSKPEEISVGYVDEDKYYHQITFYCGESDTTPSLFTKKVRGTSTYDGDFGIAYIIHLRKRLFKKPMITELESNKVIRWSLPPLNPDIMEVRWAAYEIGSYNGFEELLVILFFTILELIAIYILVSYLFSVLKLRNK